MAQEDRLKKQIDELGRILGKILADFIGKNNPSSISDPIADITQTIKSELDLDFKKLISVQPDNLLETITSDTVLQKEHLEVLADIFFQLGKALIAQDRKTEGNKMYLKSLRLLEHITVLDKTYSFDRQFKIQEIKNAL